MTMADLRNGLRTGLVFGVIVLFLALIGFPFVAAKIFTGMFSGRTVDVGTPASLIATLGLLGFWAGATRARLADRDDNTWHGAIVRGLTTGAASGLIFAVFIFVIATERAMKVDLRRYLYQLSPAAIDMYTIGQSPIVAALISLALFALTGLLGAAAGYGLSSLHADDAIRQAWGKLSKAVSTAPAVGQVKRSPVARYILFGVLGLILLVIPLFLSNYWVFILGTIGIYVLIGLGLNIVVGFAGLLDLGYVAFYAVGAYTVAMLTAPNPHHILWSFWVALPIGIALAGIAGVLLGIPVLRLRGDYLAIVTLAFGEIVPVVIRNLGSVSIGVGPWRLLSDFNLTNGVQGLNPVGRPMIFGFKFGFDPIDRKSVV